MNEKLPKELDIKKNFLKLKNSLNEMQNRSNSFNDRLYQAELYNLKIGLLNPHR